MDFAPDEKLMHALWGWQDALERKCVEFMLETMSCDTVCLYHAAAQKYGQLQLLSKSLEWLEKCLMSQASVTLLREIR